MKTEPRNAPFLSLAACPSLYIILCSETIIVATYCHYSVQATIRHSVYTAVPAN